MKKYTFSEYLQLAHSEHSMPSSKRLYGAIGYVTVQTCLLSATILSLVRTGELSSILSGLIEFDLVTSAALLGLSTITGAFGGGRKMSINKETEDEDIHDDNQ